VKVFAIAAHLLNFLAFRNSNALPIIIVSFGLSKIVKLLF